MNDPHVVALVYRVRHHDGVEYSKAAAMTLDCDGFSVKVEDGTAQFLLKRHHATEREARNAVEPFIRTWEFDASLQREPGCFRLVFDKADIVDRAPTPTPGAIRVRGEAAAFHVTTPPATGKVSPPTYPMAPSGIDIDHPDVAALYQRYKGFRAGKEPVSSFAYFCLTVLEKSVGQGKGLRHKAARTYHVDYKILHRIGELCSTKGGGEARKAHGATCPFSHDDRRLLSAATVTLIRRLAEYHGGFALSEITYADIGHEP